MTQRGDMDPDALVEFGAEPPRTRGGLEPLTTSLGAGFVVGMAGLVTAVRAGFSPAVYGMLGAGVMLAAAPVVAIFRRED